MRLITFFTLLLFGGVAIADNLSYPKSFHKTPSGGSPLAATYSTGATSQVLSGIAFLSQVCVTNYNSGALDVNFDAGSTAPSTGSPEIFLPSGATVCSDSHGNWVYIRSDSGTLTSGGDYFGYAR